MLLLIKITALEVVYEGEVFSYRHILIERRLLGEEAYNTLCLDGMLENVYSVYICSSGGAREISREDIHSRTFSRTVRTEKTYDLPFSYLKADVVKRIIVPVTLYKIFYLYHFFVAAFCGFPSWIS